MEGFGGDEFVPSGTRSRSVILSRFHAMRTVIVILYGGNYWWLGGGEVRVWGARGEGFLQGQCTSREFHFLLPRMNGIDRGLLAWIFSVHIFSKNPPLHVDYSPFHHSRCSLVSLSWWDGYTMPPRRLNLRHSIRWYWACVWAWLFWWCWLSACDCLCGRKRVDLELRIMWWSWAWWDPNIRCKNRGIRC